MFEISAAESALPLARASLNRDYEARDRADLATELAANPDTRVVLLHGATTPVEHGALRLFRLGEVGDLDDFLYLGRTLVAEGGTAIDAPIIALDVHDTALASDWAQLRVVGATLSAQDAAIFTEALALANWHRTERFCPRCGTATQRRQAGWSRHCPNCGAELFPRTDPAIIVLVTDDADRCLLGSNALWREGQYSLLAGFVEAGESLEQAVVREVFEEAGVRVVAPEYRGSQPWPLPRSLMLGYRARTAPGFDPATVEPDGAEILDLRWFSRDELRAAQDTIFLPGTASIARALLDDWIAEDGGEPLRIAVSA